MSWSDDTRCLYCEGRLPLYRKITHGQFCSSAHRKSYWQEQERLAIERLQESHSSLRSFGSATHHDPQADAPREAAAHLDLERVTPVIVAAGPEPETALALDPLPSAGVTPDALPDMSEPPLPVSEWLSLLAPDFLGVDGNSPGLVAADPFEYEMAIQPFPPSHGSALRTSPLPEGQPVAAWSYLGPAALHARQADVAASIEYDVHLRHPGSRQPSVEMRAAGRVELPARAAFKTSSPAAAREESSLQILEMQPAPVTSVEFEVPVRSDVLLQLLDQQVPHPDRMLSLAGFAAHQPAWQPVCAPPTEIDVTVPMASPAAAGSVRVPDHQPLRAEMVELPAAGLAARGNVAIDSATLEIPAVFSADPQAWVSAAAMPALRESVHELGTAGLQSLGSHLSQPASVAGALRAVDSVALDLSTDAAPDVSWQMPSPAALQADAYRMGMTGLRSLPSNLFGAAQGVLALPAEDLLAFDFSTGVSSDVTYPGLGPAGSTMQTPLAARLLPLTFAKKRKSAGDTPRVEPIARLLPQELETRPVLPNSGLEPLDRKPPEDATRRIGRGIGSAFHTDGLRRLDPAWAHVTGFWQHAPRDLKLLLFAIPALLALVFHPGLPRVAFAAPQSSSGLTGGFKRVLNTEWANVRQTLENRAAVALDEDFRSGLDEWVSPGGSTTEWSFDATGFVRPGPLALYRPSVSLTDYQVQFLGLIDKKALSWVVRAADFENFYVVKLEVPKPGPMAALRLTRYAVIGGKAQDRHDSNIPLTVAPDTLYRVRMDVQGSDFALEVQGQIADSWTETRLPRGGIGFFTASGEASRLRWVQITHQYDMLGRLCAYLAPYDTTNGSWQP